MIHDALLSPAGESVYRAAVERGRLPIAALTQRIGLPADGVEPVIGELHRHGLVEVSDGDLVPLPPRTALEAIAARQDLITEQAHRVATDLSRLWEKHTRGLSYIELIESDELVDRTMRRLLEEAQHEVQGLSMAPARNNSPEIAPSSLRIVGGFHDAIARGVTFRAVYGLNVLRDADSLARVQECIRLGEEARVFPDVPFRLIVADGRHATLTIPGTGADRRHALLVHSSGLLDQLRDLFESFWRMAVPITSSDDPAGDEPGHDKESRQLLAYLSAGLTDESIARELGVSERTVGRRIARLQEVLGAHSRFQLGVQAVRQGWI